MGTVALVTATQAVYLRRVQTLIWSYVPMFFYKATFSRTDVHLQKTLLHTIFSFFQTLDVHPPYVQSSIPKDALLKHFDDVDNSVIPDHATNYSVDTRYKTVHHDEEFHYETITKHVCKVCGHVKED